MYSLLILLQLRVMVVRPMGVVESLIVCSPSPLLPVGLTGTVSRVFGYVMGLHVTLNSLVVKLLAPPTSRRTRQLFRRSCCPSSYSPGAVPLVTYRWVLPCPGFLGKLTLPVV